MRKLLGYTLILIGISPIIAMVGMAIYMSNGFVLIPMGIIFCIFLGIFLAVDERKN